jgi:hypothetical protein
MAGFGVPILGLPSFVLDSPRRKLWGFDFEQISTVRTIFQIVPRETFLLCGAGKLPVFWVVPMTRPPAKRIELGVCSRRKEPAPRAAITGRIDRSFGAATG